MVCVPALTRHTRLTALPISRAGQLAMGEVADKAYFRDVAAGIAIVEEAGGLVTTAMPPAEWATAPVEDVRLGSRLYLAIR